MGLTRRELPDRKGKRQTLAGLPGGTRRDRVSHRGRSHREGETVLYCRILSVILLFVGAGVAAQSPHHLGVERQLFVDDHWIEASSGLRRVIHQVTKYEDNPIVLPVKPWEGQYTLLYGTVLHDEQEGIWKMWYSTMNHFRYINFIFPESTYLCYATSKDGIHWQKPALGIVDYRGTRENNIVLEGTH